MPSLSCTCVLECWTQSIITYYMLLNKIHHSGPSPSFWNLILYPTHWSPSLTLAFFPLFWDLYLGLWSPCKHIEDRGSAICYFWGNFTDLIIHTCISVVSISGLFNGFFKGYIWPGSFLHCSTHNLWLKSFPFSRISSVACHQGN